jgi:hypothetical protein
MFDHGVSIMIRTAHARFAAVLVGLPVLCPAAVAFDALTLMQSPEDSEAAPTAEKGPEVRVSVAALAWLTGIDGTFTLDGDSYDIDPSFRDIADASDTLLGGDFMLDVEVGRFLFYVDAFLVRIGVDDVAVPNLGMTDARQALDIVEFGVGYEIASWELGATPSGARHDRRLDLTGFVGGCYNRAGLRLNDAASGGVLLERNAEWVDPLVGAQVSGRFADWIHLDLRGDVGGLGAGSQLTWGALAAVGLDFPVGDADLSLMLGYKALYIDYEEGGGANEFKWDATIAGPFVGLKIAF